MRAQDHSEANVRYLAEGNVQLKLHKVTRGSINTMKFIQSLM